MISFQKTLPATVGKEAELAAKDYLTNQGLRWIASNYHCRFGELDLIMLDQSTLVFVEVRARKTMNYGGAVLSVTRNKQDKLIKSAHHFLLTHKHYANSAYRFDILALQGQPWQMEWVKNAILRN